MLKFRVLKPDERWGQGKGPTANIFYKSTVRNNSTAVFSVELSTFGQRQYLVAFDGIFDDRHYKVDKSPLKAVPLMVVEDTTIQPPARHLMTEADLAVLHDALTEQMTNFEYAPIFGTSLTMHDKRRLELKGRILDELNEFSAKAFPHAAPKKTPHK